MKQYHTYTVEDFAADTHFRKWILRGGTVTEFWQFFLSNHPEKMQELLEAAELVRLLQFKKSTSNHQSDMEVELNQVLKKINSQSPPLLSSNSRSLLQYAAILFLFLFAGSLWFAVNHSGQVIHTTQFGEHELIILPDGSKATLNANSSISYPRKWESNQVRTISLEGEAFFEVVHYNTNNPFIVKAGTFDVEVTGTSFNVVNRPSKHQVVLEEGKIGIHLATQAENLTTLLTETQLEEIRQKGTLQLKPNQLIETSLKEKKLIQKEVNSDNYTSWLRNKFVCDHLPMTDLGLFIENNYGWQVQIKDATLAQQEINGTIPTDNIEVILKALPLLLNAQMSVDKQKKEIIFTSNPS